MFAVCICIQPAVNKREGYAVIEIALMDNNVLV